PPGPPSGGPPVAPAVVEVVVSDVVVLVDAVVSALVLPQAARAMPAPAPASTTSARRRSNSIPTSKARPRSSRSPSWWWSPGPGPPLGLAEGSKSACAPGGDQARRPAGRVGEAGGVGFDHVLQVAEQLEAETAEQPRPGVEAPDQHLVGHVARDGRPQPPEVG